MRAIAVLLLLANAGYFGWNWYNPKEAAAKVTVTSSRGPTLELLEERRPVFSAGIRSAIENPLQRDDLAECEGIGPFSSVSSSQSVQERLSALDFPVAMKTTDSETGSYDYRVMIPPHRTADDAFRQLRELQGRGIDSYVITQGSDALGISMGVFSTEEAARRVREDLRGQGYDTNIMRIPQLNREYWLFPEDDVPVDDRVFQVLGEDYFSVTTRLRGCQPTPEPNPELTEEAPVQG